MDKFYRFTKNILTCVVISDKLTSISKSNNNKTETDEAEITAATSLQRACVAESQARNELSNGPRRVQSNDLTCQIRVFCNVRNASVSGDMFVSCKAHGGSVNPRWHRG